MEDKYLTIEALVRGELEVKGSKFIATAKPVKTEEETRAFLQDISSKFWDASHNPYAYKLGGGVLRCNDAGEPSGTAGKPILSAIDSQGLTDLALIVTRYFGGTKLGVGGLIRAYHQAALSCLQGAKVVTAYLTRDLTLEFPYDQTNTVKRVLSQFGAQPTEEEYSDRVRMTVAVRRSLLEKFQRAITEATNGKAKITL